MSLPRITIVTPSFNQGRYLEATIRSVLSQDYPNLEYMVVDGGSTDGSLEIIRRYGERLTWWTSEPDEGQSDAIIKGFDRATGAVMNWLNSDDLLRPGALMHVGHAFADGEPGLIIGTDRQFEQDPERPVRLFQPTGYSYPECLRFWGGKFKHHQPCTFFSSALYRAVGGLDRDLHFTMDYDLYCRMLAHGGFQVRMLDAELSAFRLHPDSKTSRFGRAFISEFKRVSRSQWPVGWGRKEERAMRRQVSEWLVLSAAEAARDASWLHCAAALAGAAAESPFHALRFLAARSALRAKKRFRSAKCR